MRKHPSIFDREMRILGRSLNTSEKISVLSKYASITSLLVLTPFLLFDHMSIRQLYSEPKEKYFEEVTFQVHGAARSPATIIVMREGNRVFFSPCDGLSESICSHTRYWEKPTQARNIYVTEIRPKNGIIRKIQIVDKNNNVIQVNNLVADNYIRAYPKNSIDANEFLLAIFGLSTAIFIASRLLSRRNHEGK